MKQRMLPKKELFIRLTWKDTLITVGFLAIATLCCFLMHRGEQADSHAPLIFVLAILLISRFTNSYFYGMLSSVIAVVEVNYIFTYPYFYLNFTLSGYIDFFVDFLERLRPSLYIERFAGEVPPRFVNHTPWGLIRNTELLRLLEQRLEQRNTWQGRLLER